MLPIVRSGPEPLSPLLSLAWTFSLEYPPYPTSSSPAVPLMLMRCMEFIISSLPLSPSLRKLPCIIHISFYPQCCHPRPCQPTTLQSPMKTPSRSHTAAPCLPPLAASHSHSFFKDFQSGLPPSHGSLQTVDFFISVSCPPPFLSTHLAPPVQFMVLGHIALKVWLQPHPLMPIALPQDPVLENPAPWGR